MRSIEIDPAIKTDILVMRQVESASAVLGSETSGSRFRDEVSASWTVVRNPPDPLRLRLAVSDGSGEAGTIFSTDELKDRDCVERKVRWLWGDFLQALSHDLIKNVSRTESSTRQLDGDEALERIIDSLAEFREREGHEPGSIRLPIRYATALMKLGPSYWGEFYREIWKSGLRAFEGQNLLGMKVELVPGVDADLQVA